MPTLPTLETFNSIVVAAALGLSLLYYRRSRTAQNRSTETGGFVNVVLAGAAIGQMVWVISVCILYFVGALQGALRDGILRQVMISAFVGAVVAIFALFKQIKDAIDAA